MGSDIEPGPLSPVLDPRELLTTKLRSPEVPVPPPDNGQFLNFSLDIVV